ncbi:hypothetical protein DFH27DRAFT_233032 [Peziza echinospora]|nr:hypothetical protein DFH27DRAFT_233032 [Peziza echinospora]
MPPHAHGHCSTLPNPSKLVSSIFSQNNKKPKKKVSFQPTISNGHDTLKDQDRMSISYISQFPLAAVAKCFCSMVTFKSSDAQPSTHMHMDLGSELVGSIKTKSSTTCIVSHVPPKFRVIHQAQQSCLNSENSHAQLISLSQLISTRQEHYEKPTQYDRVVLAVKLVFAVMQLGTTEWLNQEWSADDILFPLPEVENRYRHVNILQKPLVQRKFNAIGLKGGRESLGMDTTPQSQSHSATTSATHSIVGSNRGLYCLGIILMELYHWQPFSKLYSPEQYPTPDYAAWHLAQNFEKDACNDLQYADTVRRCIRGMDVRGEESLERDVYRRAVYEKVVEPLEVYLRKFVGEEAFMELIS